MADVLAILSEHKAQLDRIEARQATGGTMPQPHQQYSGADLQTQAEASLRALTGETHVDAPPEEEVVAISGNPETAFDQIQSEVAAADAHKPLDLTL